MYSIGEKLFYRYFKDSYLACGATGLNGVISVHLHPFFVYTSSEYSGQCAHVHAFAWASFSGNCTKHQYLLCWPVLVRLHVMPS